MQRDFLDYYKDNLQFLRVLSQEFAAEFPKIAARLEMNEVSCKDPFVERLLEGTAFLCARIDKRLDEGYPRLLSSLISICAPFAQLPAVPAGVGRVDDSRLYALDGLTLRLPAGTRWRAPCEISPVKLELSLLFDCTVRALFLENTAFRLSESEIPGAESRSSLSFELNCPPGRTLGAEALADLDLFFHLADPDASFLCSLIMEGEPECYVKSPSGELERVKLKFAYTMLSAKQLLFNEALSANQGLTLLYLFLAYPWFFKFVRVRGLERSRLAARGSFKLIICFKRRYEGFAGKVNAQSVVLNALPLVNFFKKRLSRSELNFAYEYHLSAERTAPLDYEIVRVQELEAVDSYNRTVFKLHPFFSAKSRADEVCTDFFDEHKRPRTLNQGTRLRSSYVKNETFVTLSGAHLSETYTAPGTLELAGTAWCSNADLALFVKPGQALEAVEQQKLGSPALLFTLSPPRPPLVQSGRQDDFQKFAYILLNLAPFLYAADDEGLQLLRALVTNYSVRSPDENALLAQGLLNLKGTESTFRLVEHGCVYFERGFTLTLTLSQRALSGVGYYTLARVLCVLLKSYAPLNLPLKIEAETLEGGHLFTWTSLNGI